MAKSKKMLLLLLALVLIFPLPFAAAAVLADEVEPGGNAGAELTPAGWPKLSSTYVTKGRITYYNMDGDKVGTASAGLLICECQFMDGVKVRWEPTDYTPLALDEISAGKEGPAGQLPALEKAPQMYCSDANGGVGHRLRNDKGKYKNKPCLCVHYEAAGIYYTINAKIKLDSTTGTVKSIKGYIQGRSASVPSTLFEGKFTATPASP